MCATKAGRCNLDAGGHLRRRTGRFDGCASARKPGAGTICIVDEAGYRLDFAISTYGAVPIDFSDVDPAEKTLGVSHRRGVDAAIDAVGMESKESTTDAILTTIKAETSSRASLRQCIAATRRGGHVSVPGVCARFTHTFMFGDAFEKGLTVKLGQTHVQRFLPELLEHVDNGDLQPDVIILHRIKLADAADGYKMFSDQADECRKVVLTP